MSLRRSPRRTAAFLAANRANAQKSTGPRNLLGKQRFAANALRTGKRASPAFWPRVLSHSELAEFQCDLSSIPTIGPAVGAVRMPEAKLARVHVITRVTCTGHPAFNRGSEGVPLSLKAGAKPHPRAPEIRMNPECLTKQEVYKNIAPIADSHRASEAQRRGPERASVGDP